MNELLCRGFAAADFIVISGDAYVDHPSFGHAVIARLIERESFAVGIIPQPVTDADYQVFGRPVHAFLVTSGVVDSMVNNYTAAKKPREEDVYSEGGIKGKRPDRALMVYCNALKRLYPDVPMIIGGIEASLRRLSHYDYWADKVMPSILADTGADLLVYGMGERPMWELCARARKNIPLGKVRDVAGTAYLTELAEAPDGIRAAVNGAAGDDYIILHSHSKVSADKTAYAKSFKTASLNVDSPAPKILIEKQDYTRYVVVNPPAAPLTEKEADTAAELLYERAPHPSYTKGVPAIEEVEFSIYSHRGCFGSCSFCALSYHQGRAISRRSADSIIAEAKKLTASPRFKGYIHDIGGPSANFYGKVCTKNEKCRPRKNSGGILSDCAEGTSAAGKGQLSVSGAYSDVSDRAESCHLRDNQAPYAQSECSGKCVGFNKCPNLKPDHKEYFGILRRARSLPGVKKVFVRSGVRFDYLLPDDPKYIKELAEHHVSGQLKIAPEHISDSVLKIMNKPPHKAYEAFEKAFSKASADCGKEQYLVPYFISSHPGTTLNDAVELAIYLKKKGYMPLQVQDFYPTPGTRSTVMYYTGLDPETMKEVYVARDLAEKAMQRALLQYRKPQNRRLVIKALELIGRTDLIGWLV